MKVSIIYPIYTPESSEAAPLKKNLEDIKNFFARFPINVELIFVVDPPHHFSTDFDFGALEHQLILNQRHIGRGPSILAGLKAASGDAVLVASFDFSTPLAEYFNFLQEIVLNPTVQVVVGNRYTSRKKMMGTRSRWHQVLEDIVKEKAHLLLRSPSAKPARATDSSAPSVSSATTSGTSSHTSSSSSTPNADSSATSSSFAGAFPMVQDPTCSFIGLRKSALEILLPELSMQAWFYSPEIIQSAREKNLHLVEAPIIFRQSDKSKIPLWREFLRHLF